MELLLHLAEITFSMSVSSLLSSLRLAMSLAGGLLFLLRAITMETTKKTEITKTSETTKTINMQTIRRREGDNVQYTIMIYNNDTCGRGCGRWIREEGGKKMG